MFGVAVCLEDMHPRSKVYSASPDEARLSLEALRDDLGAALPRKDALEGVVLLPGAAAERKQQCCLCCLIAKSGLLR